MLRHFLDQSKRFTFMKFFSLRLSFLTVVLTLPSVFSQSDSNLILQMDFNEFIFWCLSSDQPLSANFVVALYGANVIGTPGDPNGYGTAYLSFDTNLAILYYRIEYDSCFFSFPVSDISLPFTLFYFILWGFPCSYHFSDCML